MNSRELFEEVKRLKRRKEKNEANLTSEELSGRYRKAYEMLCMDLKEKQCELRTKYMHIVAAVSGVMAESVYQEDSQEDSWLDKELNRIYEESGKDPLMKRFCLTFWEFGEERWRTDEDERTVTR